MLRLIKLAAIKAAGVLLLVIAAYFGIISLYGINPEHRQPLLKYGSMCLAWFFGACGLTILQYKPGVASNGEDAEKASESDS